MVPLRYFGQVLIERGQASPALEQMVRYCCPKALLETLKSEEEFWTGTKTVAELKKGKYFHAASKRKMETDPDDDPVRPHLLFFLAGICNLMNGQTVGLLIR